MSEVLTLAEMEDRFKSEWILVENPETDDSLEIIRGNVIFHSPDRDAVYRKAIELKLPNIAFLYTGKIPDDAAVIL
jgi:hypothetical protein